jgi:STAS domain
LGLLIWADGSIAAASPHGHADIESSLAALCRAQPVSVLCVYDRGGAGTRQLDLAVTHHPDELRDQQALVHHDRHRLALGGEFDLDNLDVLSTALQTLTAHATTGDTPPAVPTLQVDLRQLNFLSVAAARTLDIATAGYRRHGGRVELHHPSPHRTTVLHLLNLHRLPGLTLLSGAAAMTARGADGAGDDGAGDDSALVLPRRRYPSAGVPSGRGDPDGGGAANVTATDSERAVTRVELTRPRPGGGRRRGRLAAVGAGARAGVGPAVLLGHYRRRRRREGPSHSVMPMYTTGGVNRLLADRARGTPSARPLVDSPGAPVNGSVETKVPVPSRRDKDPVMAGD